MESDSEFAMKAVVFDMDGLMFNTEDIYDQVGQIVLSRRGHDFTAELKHKMMGLRSHEALTTLIDHCGLDDSVEQIESESYELFGDLLPKQIATMPGLLELLTFLENASIPKAVATSSAPQFAEMALGCFQLQPRFEFVLTSDDVSRGKPEPDVYLLAAERFSLLPAEMLVLEDSVTGTTAAVRAGALTVAVPNRHTEGLDFSHVEFIADTLHDPLIPSLMKSGHNG